MLAVSCHSCAQPATQHLYISRRAGRLWLCLPEPAGAPHDRSQCACVGVWLHWIGIACLTTAYGFDRSGSCQAHLSGHWIPAGATTYGCYHLPLSTCTTICQLGLWVCVLQSHEQSHGCRWSSMWQQCMASEMGIMCPHLSSSTHKPSYHAQDHVSSLSCLCMCRLCTCTLLSVDRMSRVQGNARELLQCAGSLPFAHAHGIALTMSCLELLSYARHSMCQETGIV